MPEARRARARRSLPAGYQFPTPEHVHARDGFDVVRLEHVCRCGAHLDAREPGLGWFFHHWNVVEGEEHWTPIPAPDGTEPPLPPPAR